MNALRINRIANKYQMIFERQNFKDVDEYGFMNKMRADMENAGFKYDKLQALHEVVPNIKCDALFSNPAAIRKITDMQTVMNTIFTAYRYACKSDGYDLFTPQIAKWFAVAFEHLAELTEDALGNEDAPADKQ